jgi:hypothetical protein
MAAQRAGWKALRWAERWDWWVANWAELRVVEMADLSADLLAI